MPSLDDSGLIQAENVNALVALVMDPQMPDGWYAVSTLYPHTKGTMVYIRH